MTSLYIKTHNVTGLKYFGKTILNDIHKYRGSGSYWSNHIKKHGYDVTTEIYAQFDETDYIERILLEGCALMFSSENNIVNSKEWANAVLENGMNTFNMRGFKHSEETIERIRISKKKILPNGKSVGSQASHNGVKTRKETYLESGKTIEEECVEKWYKTMSQVQESGLTKFQENGKKFSEFLSTITENGLTNSQNSTRKAFLTRSEIIEENGKSRHENALEKMKETVNTIQENGLTIAQERGIKVGETLRLNKKRSKNNNPAAKKINIFNSFGEIIFKCHGNFDIICKENNLPLSAFKKSYQKNTFLYLEIKKNSNKIKEKYIQFIGWYARIEDEL